jgi:hypothetical protein
MSSVSMTIGGSPAADREDEIDGASARTTPLGAIYALPQPAPPTPPLIGWDVVSMALGEGLGLPAALQLAELG